MTRYTGYTNFFFTVTSSSPAICRGKKLLVTLVTPFFDFFSKKGTFPN